MATIAGLVVEISARSQKFQKAMQGAQKRVDTLRRVTKEHSKRIENSLRTAFGAAASSVRDFTKKAAARLAKFAKQARGIATRIGKWVAAGLTAAAAAVTTVVTQTSLAMRDLVRDAEAVGTTARDLQAWQFAAKSMGVEADKVGDVFKDMQDKIGDFVRTGGGEAADVFEQLGLNAREFIGLSPDQSLLRIGAALEGLSQGEKIFFMESIADDASRLLPLLDNNAERFEALAKQGADWGNIMTDAEIKASAALGTTLSNAGKMAKGFKNLLGANLAPTFQAVVDWIGQIAEGFGGPREAAQAASKAIITSMASAIEGVSELIRWINDLRVALMKVQRIELATEAGASQVRSFVTGEGQTDEQRRLAEFDSEIARLESGETGADAVVERLRGLAETVGQTSDMVGKGGDGAGRAADAFDGATRQLQTSAQTLQGLIPTRDQSEVPSIATPGGESATAYTGLNLSSITPMSQDAVRAMQASNPAATGAAASAAASGMAARDTSRTGGGKDLGTLRLTNDKGDGMDFFTENADAATKWLADTLGATASSV